MGLVGPLVGGIVGGLGVTSASVASALWQREAFVQTVANKCDLMSVLQSLAPIYHVLIHVTLFPSSHRRGQKNSLTSGFQWVRRELTPGIYENIKSPQIGQIPSLSVPFSIWSWCTVYTTLVMVLVKSDIWLMFQGDKRHKMSKVLNVEERSHFLRINQKSPRLSCFSDTCLLYKNWDALSVLVSLCQLYVTLPKQPYIMVSKIFIFRCAIISSIEHCDR